MLKVEKNAKTLDEALRLAAEELGVSKDEVSYTITKQIGKGLMKFLVGSEVEILAWRTADEDDCCQLCYFFRSTALGNYRRHFGANSQRIPTSFLKQISQGKGNIWQPSKHGLSCRQVTVLGGKSDSSPERILLKRIWNAKG